ncbi:MAG: hypothetical protein ING84_10540 [Cytophagales bacterium]|nr:hypothetical protein [Cytophagales bacterium]MCA6367834.1 hypothetical protein [Cytophagales bacterium]MCA6373627.1 hypothetical protein [Cytophagales bacterium]MCA6375041.1 hypothetical protein [Cytophagales bacterium]MCA6382648.1 hypothetical protein [Cytophagales bacterium]
MAINVLSAVYASPNKGVDVTEQCIDLMSNGTTSFKIDPTSFSIQDPDPYVVKGFTIKYRINGTTKCKGGKDGDSITLN